MFKYGNQSDLVGYVDASFANNNDRKSTSGFISFFNYGPIMWFSKKQSVVALSSTEAEYIALCLGSKEIVWLRNILKELKLINEDKPILIYEDNQATIMMAKSGSSTKRTKHIDIKYHFIKEQINNGVINLQYCETNSMIADLFTKPLQKIKFQELINRSGMLKAEEDIVKC